MSDNQQQPQQQPCPGHVVTCANCRNTPGRHPRWPAAEECPVCKGVGSVLLK